MSKFVIVIDAQNDFILANGALPVPNAENKINNITKYLSSLDMEEVIGVLFTFDTHSPQEYYESSESSMFPLHCVKGTSGWDIPKNFVVTDIPTYKLEKNVFNMWEQDNLSIMRTNSYMYDDITVEDRDAFFNRLKEKTNNIDVIGFASDFCVKWAIQGLVDRGFNITVYRDMTEGIVNTIDEVVNSTNEFNGKVVVI